MAHQCDDKIVDMPDDEYKAMIANFLERCQKDGDDLNEFPRTLARVAMSEVYPKTIVRDACKVMDCIFSNKKNLASWKKATDILECALDLWEQTAKASYFTKEVLGRWPPQRTQ